MHSFGTYKVNDFLKIDPVQWLTHMCKAGKIVAQCHESKEDFYHCEWKDGNPPEGFERNDCSPFCSVRNSYIDEFNTLQKEFKDLNLDDYYIFFEYIIRRDGTRPDILLINSNQLIILEFLYLTGGKKDNSNIFMHETKLGKYVSDFKFCHEETLDKKEIISALVLTGKTSDIDVHSDRYGDWVFDKDHLNEFLKPRIKNGTPMDIDRWLDADYNGSMSILEGAIRLFHGKSIPRITFHESGTLPEGDHLPEAKAALVRAFEKINTKKAKCKNCLCIITGVPGSGKTLLGLDFMFDELKKHPRKRSLAKYISASETLIDVLGHSIRPTFFQKVKEFNRSESRTPKIIIYDEAQRAWTEEKMEQLVHDKQSQAAKIIEKSETVSPGMVVAIIGRKQDIGPGEKSDLDEWIRAINKGWSVYCPPEYTEDFQGAAGEVNEVPSFNLDTALRYRGIQVSDFVDHLIDSSRSFDELKKECEILKKDRYIMLLTDDFYKAKMFCEKFYYDSCNAFYRERKSKKRDEITILDPKFGGYTSSHNSYRNHDWHSDVVEWYTADSDDKNSCCKFSKFETEYQALGFDLDMVVLNWGDDFFRVEESDEWTTWSTPNEQSKDNDINTHIQNAYRVLMTRGKDGIIICLPHRDGSFSDDNESFLKQEKYTYKYLRDIGFDEITEDLIKGISPVPSKKNG